jgi:hypothetical protein
VPDAATDAEFAKHWAESDHDLELAVESFLATFEQPEAESDQEPGAGTEPGTDNAPARAPRGAKKSAAE